VVEAGDWRTVECWRTAWGAQDVLEAACAWEALAPALAGSAYVAAFSGKRGKTPLDVRDMAAEIASLERNERVCLVFGPQTSALSDDERALRGRRVPLPTPPAQRSLNPPHAVMVAAYEVSRAGQRTPPAPRRASHEEKERLLGLLRDGLRAIEALPAVNT